MKNTKRLAIRYLIAIIIVILIFSSGAFIYQIRTRIIQAHQALDEVLTMIKESYLPPVAAGVFHFDDQQLQLLVNGIKLLPYIESVEVNEFRSGERVLLASKGKTDDKNGETHIYPLIHEYQGKQREIGSLHITTSMADLRENITEQVRMTILFNLLLIFGFAVVILLIANHMIFRHLRKIADFVLQIDPKNIKKQKLDLARAESKFKSNDELGQIKNAINEMLENLDLQLKEKETLIKELFHRTYNNMQVIQALLSYHSRSYPDISLTQFVEEINNQIRAMALAHRVLYRSGHLSKIDLGEYLRSLVQQITRKLNSGKDIVSISYKLDSIEVLLDTALPVGIAVNELVTNSLRNASPDDCESADQRELVIACARLESGEIEVHISINWINWETESEDSKVSNREFGIAVTLVEQQLNGTITFEKGDGTTCIIRFHDNQYTERV